MSNNNSDREYWLYLDDWARRQEFERQQQEAIRRRAEDFPPRYKNYRAKNGAESARPTDMVFGLLLLAFSGWLAFRVYEYTENGFYALGAFLVTGALLDKLYKATFLGPLVRWLIRLIVVLALAFAIIASFV